MNNLKFVHTGDLHIGSLFTSTPDVAESRRTDLMMALRKTVEITNTRKSDVLLIAGDLFDSLKVEADILTETKDILSSCECEVYISPGNHDPATPDSCYALGEVWPENVHIFRGGFECMEIPDKNACVWGAAFTRSFQLDTLLENVKLDDSKINFLLLHGEVYASGEPESKYDPISLDSIRSMGFEYAALGHRHKYEHHAFGDRNYAYCGVPEGRGFDEQGEKGILAGYVNKGYSFVEFIPVSERKYISDSIDVSGCGVVSQFTDTIIRVLKKRYGDNFEKNLYDITLRGELPRGVMADVSQLTAAMKDKVYFIRFSDTTTTELDINMLGKDTTLRGAFARAISNKILNDERNRDKYLRALLYGLRAFDGEVKISDD